MFNRSKRIMELGTAGVVMLGAAAPADAVAAAIPATAVIDFVKNGSIEATIDVTSVLPGSQGNGLTIEFLVGSTSGVFGSNAWYAVVFEGTRITPYTDVTTLIDAIPEVTAVLRSPVIGAGYHPSVTTLPLIVVLSGGVDAVVPEPGSAVLAAALLFTFWIHPRRRGGRAR